MKSRRLLALMLLISWLLLIVACGDSSNGDVGKTNPTAPANSAVNGDAVSLEQAGMLYKTRCEGCHSADGKGKAPGAPDLSNKDWQAKATDAQFYKSIAEGKGTMPAWQNMLKPAEINGLVKYTRTLAK